MKLLALAEGQVRPASLRHPCLKLTEPAADFHVAALGTGAFTPVRAFPYRLDAGIALV
jgi:hypothetical protein